MISAFKKRRNSKKDKKNQEKNSNPPSLQSSVTNSPVMGPHYQGQQYVGQGQSRSPAHQNGHGYHLSGVDLQHMSPCHHVMSSPSHHNPGCNGHHQPGHHQFSLEQQKYAQHQAMMNSVGDPRGHVEDLRVRPAFQTQQSAPAGVTAGQNVPSGVHYQSQHSAPAGVGFTLPLSGSPCRKHHHCCLRAVHTGSQPHSQSKVAVMRTHTSPREAVYTTGQYLAPHAHHVYTLHQQQMLNRRSFPNPMLSAVLGSG